MQNERGISMISLIVTIVVIVLLSSMAIGTGTKYLKESKKRDKETFVSVLSNAVSQRREDSNLSSIAYPYVGYSIKDESTFNKFASKVQKPLRFGDGMWYIIDTTTASGLGIKQSENYINAINLGSSEKVNVALVNYITSEVYLIEIEANQMTGLEYSTENITGNHEHRYLSEATCTEPKKCIDCGFILEEARGHEYDLSSAPIPTVGDEAVSHYYKTCLNCGMPGGYEIHKFKYISFEEDSKLKHKLECSVCKYIKETEECDLQYSVSNDIANKSTKHIVTCSKCGREPQLQDHAMTIKAISESMHEYYCSLCSYLYAEYHTDDNKDGKCDYCNADIVDYNYPYLKEVTIRKKVNNATENTQIAKYGDTVLMKIVADKKITKPKIIIGKQVVPDSSITSTDGITWSVSYVLAKTPEIANGKLEFNITCKSDPANIDMLAPVTEPTDGIVMYFDGIPPIVEYIPKSNIT